MNYLKVNESEFLDHIKGIISKNLDNDQFDVLELANQAGLSRTSLHRRIKAFSGMPAGVFLRKYRLERARDLLAQSSANITEIAFECGFRSLTYFDICFKDHFGYSPGKYRKDILEKNRSESEGEEVLTDAINEKAKDNPINELHNFPVPVNSFIGREEEMKIISGLLLNYRIVSLVGAGGCGKTRLACEVASHLEQKFNDGIWFVDLAPLEKGEFVAREVMRTLNIPEAGDEPIIETLVRKTKDLYSLIILDNCEHLSVECARVANRLSQSASGIRILTTSRLVLKTKGEKVWNIPTLNLVDPTKITTAEQAQKSEAVQLFMDRARLTDPRFELADENSREVTEICKKLDGIPLAVELVASRIRYMEPALMLKRLSGSFNVMEVRDSGIIDRHKTLNTAIGWSYKLLVEEEKLLFRRLSVFSGGFDLEAAEKVCSDESLPAEYILDLLSNLVDHSMINTIRNPGLPFRYYMLETIRNYSAGLLDKYELNRFRKKHVEYFISLAEKAYQERLKSQAFWIGKLNFEFDNLLAALTWSEKTNRTKYYLLAGLLGWHWIRSGYNSLARKTFGNIINDSVARNETKARILSGYCWANSGDYNLLPTFLKYSKQSIAIWHRLDNINEESVATADLALAISTIGDNENGLKLARKAMELALINNDAGVVLYSLMPLSQVLVNLKNCTEAMPLLKKRLELADQLNNLTEKFRAHHNYGDCAAIQGKFHIAETEYGKGLKITVQSGDIAYQTTELMGIAIAVSGMGRKVKALRLTGAANEGAKKIGFMSPEKLPLKFWQELIKEYIEGTREKLGEEFASKYEAEGAAMELEEAVAYALEFEKD